MITNYNSYAVSNIMGSTKYPNIHGKIIFEELEEGVMLNIAIYGLPTNTNGCIR